MFDDFDTQVQCEEYDEYLDYLELLEVYYEED
jgi:hypothetical protein